MTWLLGKHKGWYEFDTGKAHLIYWFVWSFEVAKILSSMKGTLLVFTPKIMSMLILLSDLPKLSTLSTVFWQVFLFLSFLLSWLEVLGCAWYYHTIWFSVECYLIFQIFVVLLILSPIFSKVFILSYWIVCLIWLFTV